MQAFTHNLSELFRQLGLADDPQAIDQFVISHRLWPSGLALVEAPFWSHSQSQFMREMISDDADWAILVDQLALLLSD